MPQYRPIPSASVLVDGSVVVSISSHCFPVTQLGAIPCPKPLRHLIIGIPDRHGDSGEEGRLPMSRHSHNTIAVSVQQSLIDPGLAQETGKGITAVSLMIWLESRMIDCPTELGSRSSGVCFCFPDSVRLKRLRGPGRAKCRRRCDLRRSALHLLPLRGGKSSVSMR